MIKDSELGARYYNLNNHQNGHWMIDDDKTLSVKEKVSNTKKKFWASDESSILRKKVSEFHKKRGTRPASQKGRIPWNKGLTKDTDLRVLANAIAVSKPKANTDKMGRYERKKKLDE